MSYSIIYYEKENGDCPVREFIHQFDAVRERPIIYARLALLEEHGPQLKRPYAGFLRNKIYGYGLRSQRNKFEYFTFSTITKP
jgi:hypothetical protein